MSALGLAELADRTLLEPDGWCVLVVEEARIGAAARSMASALVSLLGEEGDGTAQVFSEGHVGPALIEELTRLGPGDVALLPLSANLVEPVSHTLDYWRGRLLGRPRGVIVTSEAGLRQMATEAPHFWGWIGPRVWSGVDFPANETENVRVQESEVSREGSLGSSRLVRINGVLTIDPGIDETIPAEILDHRTADDEEDDRRLRGST